MSLKKSVYLFASTILGVLLSFIVHALIEMGYLHWAYKHNFAVTFYGGCALPPVLQAALLLVGIIGGFLLGCSWWQIVYVEKRYDGSGFICGTALMKQRNGSGRRK